MIKSIDSTFVLCACQVPTLLIPMPSLTRGTALVLLPVLFIAAVHCLFVVAIKNGLFSQITTLLEQKHALFPGSQSPLVRSYTGIAVIDGPLTFLVTFFAPIIEASSASLSLFSLFGLGQLGAVWTLLLLESLRVGNRGEVVSLYTTPNVPLSGTSH